MVRFDFMLDEQLNVYLMEANMSPNLASAKYPPNQLIYEQVIFGLFSLVGIVRRPQLDNWYHKPPGDWNMLMLDKDLSVLPDLCSNDQCQPANQSACDEELCDVCQHCLSAEFRSILKDTYLEEYSRWHHRRLIPSTSVESPVTLGHNNYLQDKWYIGKCLAEPQWCN